ncbi:hypothetical protein L593_14395 [Salinarchaeum sp. Harcht-Bsk1]|uniref:hypothetical protein n=1 Tax=Salinarchaeum sp. Harcht-Bsk1 TaxID=1333523 RepID=UPI0003422957|nr:hypothetical protein [Salinarchaeum sp. Harcht-Bsk1]AGN02818.1 hypothetical protein L593_14395 [Salinarchaeum sp. Harcht-Bsk1]
MTEASPQPTVSRRTLLRSGAVAAGGAMGMGAATEYGAIGNVRACPLCIGAAIVGAGMVGYALGRESAPEPDRSAEQAEADWENWVTFYNRARQIGTHDKTQLEQARRDANGMANLARRDAILAIYNEAVGGSSKSQSRTAAEDAVNAAFTETLKGVLNHHTSRITELEGDMQLINSSDFTTQASKVIEAYESTGDRWVTPTHSVPESGTSGGSQNNIFPPSSDGFANSDITLPNGDTVSAPVKKSINSKVWLDGDYKDAVATMLTPWPEHLAVQAYNNPSVLKDTSSQTLKYFDLLTNPRIREPNPDEYDSVNESEVDTSDFDGHQVYLHETKFVEVVEEIETIRQNVLEEVDLLVDTHYDAAKNGDISLPEMTASQGLLEAARNADSFREVALAFRTMGWAVADTATVIRFQDSQGNVREVDSKLAWARQDQPDSLEVGLEYDAGQLPGTLYIAYNYTDQNGETAATYGALGGKFTIVATESGSSTVGFEHRGVVETSDSPTDVQDEFRDTNDAEQDAEEARQDINVTSGGFTLFGGNGGLGGGLGRIVGGAIVVIGALFGINLVTSG